MTVFSLILGGILFLLGPVGYIGSGYASKTALIPSIFGILLALSGWLSSSQGTLKLPWLLAGVVVSFLGVMGSYKGLLSLWTWMQTGEAAKPLSILSRSVMTLACSLYIVIAIVVWLRSSSAS